MFRSTALHLALLLVLLPLHTVLENCFFVALATADGETVDESDNKAIEDDDSEVFLNDDEDDDDEFLDFGEEETELEEYTFDSPGSIEDTWKVSRTFKIY